jgi:hypothetical protein
MYEEVTGCLTEPTVYPAPVFVVPASHPQLSRREAAAAAPCASVCNASYCEYFHPVTDPGRYQLTVRVLLYGVPGAATDFATWDFVVCNATSYGVLTLPGGELACMEWWVRHTTGACSERTCMVACLTCPPPPPHPTPIHTHKAQLPTLSSDAATLPPPNSLLGRDIPCPPSLCMAVSLRVATRAAPMAPTAHPRTTVH